MEIGSMGAAVLCTRWPQMIATGQLIHTTCTKIQNDMSQNTTTCLKIRWYISKSHNMHQHSQIQQPLVNLPHYSPPYSHNCWEAQSYYMDWFSDDLCLDSWPFIMMISVCLDLSFATCNMSDYKITCQLTSQKIFGIMMYNALHKACMNRNCKIFKTCLQSNKHVLIYCNITKMCPQCM